MKTKTAIFLNGVYSSVLEEILTAYNQNGLRDCYLQPHNSRIMRQLVELEPSAEKPVTILMSTTTDYSRIYYKAEVINWEDKTKISNERELEVNKHIELFQKGEKQVYRTFFEKPCPNLISIRNLRKVEFPYHVSFLNKISDNKALKERTRAGGASYVFEPREELGEKALELPSKSLIDDFDKKLKKSTKLSNEQLFSRLKRANKIPEKRVVRSIGYLRNPDVVILVLRNAKGYCESCKKKAPFDKKSDGSPYLEVHHKIPLSNGGEDTVENCIALCPNCHRKEHFG